MKKLFLIGILLLALSVSFVSAQQVVKSEDVMQVVSHMQSHTCKNLLLAESYVDFGGGEQIVFIDNNKRYTFYLSRHKEKSEKFLCIWVRPEGTYDQASLETFSDEGLDGFVDSGHKGPGSWSDLQRKLFYSENNPFTTRTTGLEFRGYWQNKFNEAIAAAHRQIL